MARRKNAEAASATFDDAGGKGAARANGKADQNNKDESTEDTRKPRVRKGDIEK